VTKSRSSNVIYISDYKMEIEQINLEKQIASMRNYLSGLVDPEDVLTPMWPEDSDPEVLLGSQIFDGYTGLYYDVPHLMEGLVVS
jgi:hypothetical protein